MRGSQEPPAPSPEATSLAKARQRQAAAGLTESLPTASSTTPCCEPTKTVPGSALRQKHCGVPGAAVERSPPVRSSRRFLMVKRCLPAPQCSCRRHLLRGERAGSGGSAGAVRERRRRRPALCCLTRTGNGGQVWGFASWPVIKLFPRASERTGAFSVRTEGRLPMGSATPSNARIACPSVPCCFRQASC